MAEALNGGIAYKKKTRRFWLEGEEQRASGARAQRRRSARKSGRLELERQKMKWGRNKSEDTRPCIQRETATVKGRGQGDEARRGATATQ